MTLESNYTDLKLSKQLQSIMTGEASAWWHISQIDCLGETDVPTKYKTGDIIEQFSFESDYSNVEPPCFGLISFKETIPAWSERELWNRLPEWFQYWVEMKLLTGYESVVATAQVNAIAEFKNILKKHWADWLRIWAEMLLYLEKDGLLG